MKKNNLAEKNPELATEWHPTLNGDLTPMDVTCGMSKKVWWQCQKHKEHFWDAAVSGRSTGFGCPYCASKKILPGYNDLATKKPKLAKEWHPTLNGNLTPRDITCGSGRRAWWQCSGHPEHVWESVVCFRSKGIGCPYCSNKKVLRGYNDLATTNPLLIKEWHPLLNGNLTPSNFVAGSNKIIWWQCSRGHEWQASITARSHGTGCNQCNAERQTSFPEQAIYYYLNQALSVEVENRASVFGVEVDIYIPSWGIGIEYDGRYFHNSDKNFDREVKKNKILSKNGIQLIRIKESLDVSGQDQNIIYCVSDGRYKYLTSTLEVLADMLSKIKGISLLLDVNIERDNVEIMEQYIKSEKSRSLSVRNPRVAAEWHPTKNGRLQPEQVYGSSNQNVSWKCINGHEWDAKISDRNKGNDCPFCSNKKILPGYNDLATTSPTLAAEWHPTLNGDFKPSTVTLFSGKKAWWQCQIHKEHSWEAAISNRSGGNGCPFCSCRKTLSGYNDLATINPELAKEWHPTLNGDLTPVDVSCASHEKISWQCGNHKEHQWKATVNSRNSGKGCPYCSNRKVLTGYNDLATTHPKLAKEWHPVKNGELNPNAVVHGSNKAVWWQCGQKHVWMAIINKRSGGNGCPFCAGQRVIEGETDLATLNPELAKEWHPTLNGEMTAFDVGAGSPKKVWWQCSKHHEHQWEAIVGNRNTGTGCPYCANKKTMLGYNDLATTHPKLAKEWHPALNGDLTPNDVTAGSAKRLWWRCGNGHEWQAIVGNRKNGYSCCPGCKKQK